MSKVSMILATALGARNADVRLLRSQLAARDAALDAVLNMAHNDPQAMCDSPGESALRGKLADLLTAHGIHPK